jgi:type IV pilus assembly protein PilQ
MLASGLASYAPNMLSVVRCSILSLLVLLVACRTSVERTEKPQPEAPLKPASAPAPKPPAAKEGQALTNQPSPAIFSADHDREIKQIFDHANRGFWEEAEAKAEALLRENPDDQTVIRIRDWVSKQRQQLRDQAVEDRIREIDSKYSVFNPTISGLLREKKDRGLPPRKDVRDAVQQIESTPYVPPTFGRTVQKKGVLFELESREGRMAQVLDREVSVRLDNVTLEAIIFNIGLEEGINFVADKSIAAFQQTLSVNMEKVKLSEFLRYVSRNLDVQFQVGNDLVWVVDAKDPKRMMEQTRFYRLRKGFVMPAAFGASEVNRVSVTANNVTTVTENQKINKFVNDNAPANPAIESAIKQFFTGSKYMVDYERNLVVAQGTPDQLEVIEQIIEEFDKPIQQVLIEARFITVTEAAFLQLGVTWETGRNLLTTGRVPTDFTGLGVDVGLGLQESFTNILGRANLTATLTALDQSGESQTLSAPRLTLINNLPARISDGKIQYYYEEYQVKQTILERRTSSSLVPQGKPAKLTSGVSLDVLASISGDGQNVLLALHPEVNQDVRLVPFATLTDVDDTGKVVSTFDIKLPESRTQSLATRVIVKSGETVVMGGVLEREQRTFVEAVPVLGRLPIIGAAFRKRTEIDRPRYLLIFVTATLISESGEFIIHEDAE